jgi:hypothetical protein
MVVLASACRKTSRGVEIIYHTSPGLSTRMPLLAPDGNLLAQGWSNIFKYLYKYICIRSLWSDGGAGQCLSEDLQGFCVCETKNAQG